MARLTWDDTGKRLYETGTKQGVLYPIGEAGEYDSGVAWNGLRGVTVSPSGAEPTKLYADDINYVTLYSAEEVGATINAYTYPDEFAECNGEATLATGVYVGQQTRKTFGMSWRTILGNDVDGEKHGYKLHLLYGAKVQPSEKAYESVNDSPAAMELSWEVSTTPVNVMDMKPTAYIVIDSTKADPTCLKKLEDELYGSADGTGPRLPLPDEVKTLMTPEG